jgi:hypothetical protein
MLIWMFRIGLDEIGLYKYLCVVQSLLASYRVLSILRTPFCAKKKSRNAYVETPTRSLGSPTMNLLHTGYQIPLFLLLWMHGQKGYNLRPSLSYIHLWFVGQEAFVWSIIYIEEHIHRFYPIVLLISNEIFDIYTRLYQVNNVLTMTRWHYISSKLQRVLKMVAALPHMASVWAVCSVDCFRASVNGWVWRLAMCRCKCRHVYLCLFTYLCVPRIVEVYFFCLYSFEVFICGRWCTLVCEYTEYHI